MDFIEKWKYKLLGRTIPVFNVVDVDAENKVKSLTFGKWIRRPNSLLETWNVIGAEIEKGEGLIVYTDDAGLTVPAYTTFKGKTHNLYVEPRTAPNLEKVIGSAANLDDIAESMDLGKSMRNMVIGLLIGIMIGWLFIAPIVNGMAK
jgi:hypothetical protein